MRVSRRASTGATSPDSQNAAGGSAPTLVKDSTVKRCVMEAISAGIPKTQVRKWVVDCNRDFYVRDDASFEQVWCDLRSRWERSDERRKRRLTRPEETWEPEASTSGACSGGASCADDVPFPPAAEYGDAPMGGTSAQLRSKRLRPNVQVRGASLEARACAVEARRDVKKQLCPSYEQALAVRLSIRLGEGAPRAFSQLVPSTVVVGSGCNNSSTPLRRLALLVHPDKSVHPNATEAFQRIAPLLRTGAK
eukprot:TRINITY_DN33381_c0_g1_i1.p1 TRINITY_DN33381_c0_g1~~TRINITY_DN33381_c0_g1_i1.p1  ORF type:complete len:250 (-),score=35.23 TRINITY_DN33381_c0_g1_i1:181-930(-)